MQDLSWGLWIAIAAALVGAGTFLDRFHVSEDHRNRIRVMLVSWFVYLETPAVPDYSSSFLKILFRLWRKGWYLGLVLFVIVLGWIMISTFYVARINYDLAPEEGYWQYIFNWIPLADDLFYWGSVLLWGIGLGLITFFSVAKILSKIGHHKTILRQFGWVALANSSIYIFVAVGFFGSFYLFSDGPNALVMPLSGSMMKIPLFALALSFVVVLPSLVFVFIISMLIFTRFLLQVGQFVLLNIFDVASDPKHSPFTYLFSLMGIMILAMKILKETVI